VNSLINLIVIRVVDMERSFQFYKQLGLEFTQHRHGNGPEHYACEAGQVVFEIYPQLDEAQNTKAARIGFQVNDLDVLMSKLQDQNVKIISPPKDSPWGRRAVVDDPDGHRVELVEVL
jgi:predicted enzyme related to lactoylglutathione lyase